MKILSRSALLALSVSMAPFAAQALTADDLLAVQNEMVRRMGFTPLGTIARDADGIRMVDSGARMVLPFDWGEIAWGFGPIPLTEEADGSVLQHWDGGLELNLEYRPRPQGAKPGMADPRYRAGFTLTGNGMTSRASGTPDAVTLESKAALVEFTLSRIDMPGVAQNGDRSELVMSLQDWDSRITMTGFTPDNTGTARFESTDSTALVATRYAFNMDGMTDNGATAQEDVQNAITFDLPAATPELRSIGTALRAGLALAATSTTSATQNESTTRDQSGQTRMRQSSDGGTSRVGFDAATGLTMAATSANNSFDFTDSYSGVGNLALTLENLGLDIAVPLMANGEREKAHFAIDITNLRGTSDALWFTDLPEAFATEPFTFALTLGADYEPLQDLTDLGQFFDMFDLPDILRMYDFGIDRLETGYGEARLTGAGRLSWGLYGAIMNNDMPNPKGQATFTLTGAYALLNRLGQAGAVPAEFLTAARGAVAAFGQAKGPDEVQSTIGLGPNGFTINGAPAPF